MLRLALQFVSRKAPCDSQLVAFVSPRSPFSVAYNCRDTPLDGFHLAYGSCIMVMGHMRLEKLRQVDLNLLIAFAAIAEEKSVTAAASRLFLSVPAVSRGLHQARAMVPAD